MAILLLALSILLGSGIRLQGQDPSTAFYQRSLQINTAGMMVLGSWALVNISTGAFGWKNGQGSRLYFHQMNLLWNSVNLAIAGVALYGNMTADYSRWTSAEILARQLKTQHLYLINAALDVGYVGAGFLLGRLAPRYPKNEARLTGYGNSVMLQGTFLLLFDLVMFGLQRNQRLLFLEQATISPLRDAWGLTLAFHL